MFGVRGWGSGLRVLGLGSVVPGTYDDYFLKDFHDNAVERRGNILKDCLVFYLKSKARIWSRLSYLCHIRWTSVKKRRETKQGFREPIPCPVPNSLRSAPLDCFIGSEPCTLHTAPCSTNLGCSEAWCRAGPGRGAGSCTLNPRLEGGHAARRHTPPPAQAEWRRGGEECESRRGGKTQ